jgi:thermitase
MAPPWGERRRQNSERNDLPRPTRTVQNLYGQSWRIALYNVVRATYFAQANGARAINMSLSFPSGSPALETAVDFVTDRQVVCVASTGNQGLETMTYPAAYDRVMGIASVNDSDVQSVFTNHGDNITWVAAPGEALVTTFPGVKYAVGWGTSFAAPIVSGGVSLMIQVKYNLAWEWAQAALAEAAPVDGNLGSGRVDLARAVAKAA